MANFEATGKKVFPQPFAGLRTVLTMNSHENMMTLADYLTTGRNGCGHKHAIALFPDQNQVWVSKLGLECSQKWIP